MLIHFVIRLVLMILCLLVIVPAATGGNVAVRRGGLCKGFLILVLQALVNSALWYLLAILTAGGIIVANVLLLGLIGLLVNGLAFVALGRLMPRHLYVKGFGSAVWAALIMTVMVPVGPSAAFSVQLQV